MLHNFSLKLSDNKRFIKSVQHCDQMFIHKGTFCMCSCVEVCSSSYVVGSYTREPETVLLLSYKQYVYAILQLLITEELHVNHCSNIIGHTYNTSVIEIVTYYVNSLAHRQPTTFNYMIAMKTKINLSMLTTQLKVHGCYYISRLYFIFNKSTYTCIQFTWKYH